MDRRRTARRHAMVAVACAVVTAATATGSGSPRASGQWCDRAGRALGRAPTTRTGDARIDACLWDYAYALATG